MNVFAAANRTNVLIIKSFCLVTSTEFSNWWHGTICRRAWYWHGSLAHVLLVASDVDLGEPQRSDGRRAIDTWR